MVALSGRRSNMKRTRFLIGAIALAVTAVGAGMASGAGDRQSSLGTAQLSGHITMWDIPESDGYVAWWKGYIKRFESAHSGVSVDLQDFQSEPYKAKIQSALVAGTAPDIFYAIPGPQYQTAFREGKAAALNQWIKPSVFTPATRSACTVDGKLACVPLYLAPSYIYYNKALFAKAGVSTAKWHNPTQPTWQEFLAACTALKNAGIAPIGVGNADKWPGLFFYWALQNRIGGVTPFDNALRGRKGATFAGPSFVKAGQMLQQVVPFFESGYNGIGGDQKYDLFTQSHAAMIFMGPWMVGDIQSGAPKGFSYGFFNFPSVPGGNPASQKDIMAGVDALWISAKSSHKDVAGAFLKGFTQPKTQLAFDLQSQSISSVNGVAERATNKKNPIVQMTKLAESATHAFPWWDSALPPKIANVMLNNSQALLAGKMSPQAFGKAMDKAAR